MSADWISLRGVRATGYHGVFEHERRDGQEFVVDVDVSLDLARAGASDDLADTLDYGALAAGVVERIEGEPFDLIERLAAVIADDVRRDPRVEQVRAGDRLARAARRPPLVRGQLDLAAEPATPAQAHTQALAVLQQALRDQSMVWVGYVDAHGGTAAKLVRPVSMGAGYLRAEDDRSEMLHTFALHRITSAVLEE